MNDFRMLRNVDRFVQLDVIRKTVIRKRVIGNNFRNGMSVKDKERSGGSTIDRADLRGDCNQDREVPEMPKV